MTCGPNRTCYQGCPCREAAQAERIARLTEALRKIVANKAYWCKPHCPDVPTLPREAWCPACVARAALAPAKGEGK